MDIEGTEVKVNAKGEEIDIKIPAPGKHMLPSVLMSIAVAKSLDLTNKQIQQGVLNYAPAKMRNDKIKTDKITIINDCYNACEESIIAGLEVLELAQGRKSRCSRRYT